MKSVHITKFCVQEILFFSDLYWISLFHSNVKQTRYSRYKHKTYFHITGACSLINLALLMPYLILKSNKVQFSSWVSMLNLFTAN